MSDVRCCTLPCRFAMLSAVIILKRCYENMRLLSSRKPPTMRRIASKLRTRIASKRQQRPRQQAAKAQAAPPQAPLATMTHRSLRCARHVGINTSSANLERTNVPQAMYVSRNSAFPLLQSFCYPQADVRYSTEGADWSQYQARKVHTMIESCRVVPARPSF